MDVADRLDILDLIARYGHCYDEGDVPAVGELYVEDGVFEIRGGIGGLPSVIRGREEIVRVMSERREATQPAQRRHLATNVIIDATGDDTATVASYLLMGTTTDGQLTLPITGRYDDDLVKDDQGRWRFVKRVLTVDGALA